MKLFDLTQGPNPRRVRIFAAEKDIEQFFHRSAGSSIMVAENPGMFEKFILINHSFECFGTYKMIIYAINFSWPYGSRRMRNTHR